MNYGILLKNSFKLLLKGNLDLNFLNAEVKYSKLEPLERQKLLRPNSNLALGSFSEHPLFIVLMLCSIFVEYPLKGLQTYTML